VSLIGLWITRVGDNLKTAVLFAGHLRTFEKCYENHLHHIVEKNDVDLFFYTSKQDSHKILTHSSGKRSRRKEKPNAIRSLHIYQNSDKKIDKLHELYEPYIKAVYFEDEEYDYAGNEYKPPRKIEQYSRKDWNYFRTTQFKKVYYGFKEIEQYAENNNIQYDYFIRMRPDMTFSRQRARTKGYDIDINSLMASHDGCKNTVWVFGGWPVSKRFMSEGKALYDGFALGSFENMRNYCSLYERRSKKIKGPFTPENQLALHLKEHGIKIRYLNRDWKRYYKKSLGRGYRLVRE